MKKSDMIKELKAEYRKALESIDSMNLGGLIDNKPRFGQANTSIRITLDTKNRLKSAMKGGESFDEVINRVLGSLQKKQDAINMMQKEAVPKSYVKTSLIEYQRVDKTFSLLPDLKVYYSYNIPPRFEDDSFVFHLTIDGMTDKGKDIPLKEGIRIFILARSDTDSTAEILKNINHLEGDTEDDIRMIELEYMIYFLALYKAIDNTQKRSPRLNELLLEEFWRRIYDYCELSHHSFRHDIEGKLDEMKARIRQTRIDAHR